ncbi:acyl-CoA N-acyltransferase [Thozetella sp. PMI_491]|nr:acyl-CoA N-acyltransferase [Thozetella sp. PMI_491]
MAGVQIHTVLRRATDDDKDFCYSVHKDAMYDVVYQIWGWQEADQVDMFDRSWDPLKTQIVVVDGVQSGMLVVERRASEIFLERIELSRRQQGQGVGASILKGLQEEARDASMPLLLEVLTSNERAKALYLRLGFRIMDTHEHKINMRWDSVVEGPTA